MKTDETKWTKEELKTYILLLCAKADSIETEEELNLIKSKIPAEMFDRIYPEFCNDCEDGCLEKIQDVLENHEYSDKELAQIKKDIMEVFLSDKKFPMSEIKMGLMLDNILY